MVPTEITQIYWTYISCELPFMNGYYDDTINTIDIGIGGKGNTNGGITQ